MGDTVNAIAVAPTQGIGSHALGAQYFTGQLDHVTYVDGQQLAASDFHTVSGDKILPSKYTGAYGTNGFFVDFGDIGTPAVVENDTSGNGNNFTNTGVTQATDNVYATATYGVGNFASNQYFIAAIAGAGTSNQVYTKST